MFINYSNHPSERWSKEQLEATSKWGEIKDVPFPNIDANMTEEAITSLATDEADKIIKMRPDVVLCQGEFTFTFALINALKQNGVKVIAACSQRRVKERQLPSGEIEKTVIFEFVQFREYV